MIDINLLRTDPEVVKKNLQNRGKDVSIVDRLINLDTENRQTQKQVEELRSQQNKISKEIKGKPTDEQLKSATKIKEKLKKIEETRNSQLVTFNSLLEEIPNIAAEDVPVGKDDNDNVVIKTVGKKPEFYFKPLEHQELGEKLNIIDKERASKISGSRFGYYKNQGAILEMAIMFYAMQKLVAKGFGAMLPPLMVKSHTEWGCGYTSNKNLFGAYYSIPEDDAILISSSEHSVIPYHMDEVLDTKVFPLKYVNFSPCFRREAGTYGKDMSGMLRLHHFNKVEMNVFTLPDFAISDAMQLELLSVEEEILQDFGLHYQVVNCCTGDLPQPNRRMYDINAWFPGLNAYKETGSCSNCGDYQARRLNTKVKINGENKYVHILNSTAVTDRTLNAIFENHQQADGSITIPPCLVPLTGFSSIKLLS